MMRKFPFHLLSFYIWIALAVVNVQGQTATIEQAQALLSAGKVDAAIDILKAIPKSESTEPKINHLMGLAHYQKNDYARAVEYLSIAVKQVGQGSKQYQQAAQFLGLAHYRLGHLKESIPYLE